MKNFDTEQFDLENETWNDLIKYPQSKGIYWISTKGRYKRLLKNGKYYYSLGQYTNRYKVLVLSINGKIIAQPKIHDLVAEAFIRPFDHKTEIVHHISGIRDQNNIQNLQIMKRDEHTEKHKKGKSLSQQDKKKKSEALKKYYKEHPEKIRKKDPVTGKFIKNSLKQ